RTTPVDRRGSASKAAVRAQVAVEAQTKMVIARLVERSRDEVDHSRHRVRTVQTRARAAQHFTRFELDHVNDAGRDAGSRIAADVVESLTIDNDQHTVRSESTQAWSFERWIRVDGVEIGREFQGACS